mmetsp:Transcript_6527/g.10973  ORF Transcript_6527/g.10973 Transcript_6527/m.10973 type:complete len:443 (-) Transcript_6527:1228-2556(-)
MIRRIKRNSKSLGGADNKVPTPLPPKNSPTESYDDLDTLRNTNRRRKRLKRSRCDVSSQSTFKRNMLSLMLLTSLLFALTLYFDDKYSSERQEKEDESQDNDKTDEKNELTGPNHTATLPTLVPHVVFIGDSLLRYSYLEWLHHHQYHSPAPESLINEKLSSSWYSYFQSSTAHFGGYMKCDCRRSQTWNLGSEVENRYYFRDDGPEGSAFQAYGSNMAHGRFAPGDVQNSLISTEEDASVGYKWGYMGRDWDKLITEYVAKLEISPTLMVFNAGFWPNDDIAQKLGSILRSAKDVMGNHGRVLWKGLTPTRGEPVVHPSPSDLAAKEWSFRHPWLFYEAFNTTSSSINEEDYFDDKHFSNPHIYRQWNQGINLNQSIVHRVFILVGGVRTLRQTQQSILHNLIYPICAPPTCIAHLVIHLSSADNRPGNNEEDPGGESFAS